MKLKTLTCAAFLLVGTISFTGCTKTANYSGNTTTSSEQASSSTKSETQKSSQSFSDSTAFSNLKTTDLDGNNIDSSIFKNNKITLVNAWNIGCTPCVEETPELQKISKDYADKGVSVKGLYFNFAEDITDDEMSQIKDVLSNANATYTQLKLSKNLYKTDIMQDVMAFPTTFIVDSNGKILDKIEGSKDYDGWKKVVEKYLSKIK